MWSAAMIFPDSRDVSASRHRASLVDENSPMASENTPESCARGCTNGDFFGWLTHRTNQAIF
jgi:hypothetical protein